MQPVIGIAIFALVFIVACVVGVIQASKQKTIGELISVFIAYLLAIVFGAYIALALFGGFFWVLAWIGIFLREVLQWLIVAVLFPFQWLI